MTEPKKPEYAVNTIEVVEKGSSPGLPWGTFWFGLFLGWAIGAIIGILRAPRSGEQTLALLAEQGNEIVLQIQQQIQRDPIQEAIDEGKEVAMERMAEREAEIDAAAPAKPE